LTDEGRRLRVIRVVPFTLKLETCFKMLQRRGSLTAAAAAIRDERQAAADFKTFQAFNVKEWVHSESFAPLSPAYC
jgi:hypothetical protein